MFTIYVANDGTPFKDEYECEFYEEKMKHISLNAISFFNSKNEMMSTNDVFEEWFYAQVVEVRVPTQAALRDLQWLADYCGFQAYETITEPGVWTCPLTGSEFVRSDV